MFPLWLAIVIIFFFFFGLAIDCEYWETSSTIVIM